MVVREPVAESGSAWRSRLVSILIDTRRVAKTFKPVDREQQFLLPPSVLDWLPVGHQVWFVIDAVAQMDTSAFHRRARLGGAGQAPYHPDMLLALLIWAYAGGVTSSRQIERRCREDVAFMVVSGLARPDHATIARFRRDHLAAFEVLFTQVLTLCGRAGMGGLAHVAIDGFKTAANASKAAFSDVDGLRRTVRRLVAQAEADDAAEDERHGPDSGNDLPPDLREPRQRQQRITELLQHTPPTTTGQNTEPAEPAEPATEPAEPAAAVEPAEPAAAVEPVEAVTGRAAEPVEPVEPVQVEGARAVELARLAGLARTDPDPDRRGRRLRAVRALRRTLECYDALLARQAAAAEPILAPLRARLHQALTALTRTIEQLNTAHTAWQQRHQALIDAGGKGQPGPRPVPTEQHNRVRRATARVNAAQARLDRAVTTTTHATRSINTTDPDCRLMLRHDGAYTAGYNSQNAVTADHLVLAVHTCQDPNDAEQAETMIAKAETGAAVLRNTTRNPDLRIGTLLFDNGYNSDANLQLPGPDRLIAQGDRRHTAGTTPPTQPPPDTATPRDHMAWRLTNPETRALYRKRGATVEPVNAHLQDRRGLRRHSMRGLTAANAELHLAAAVTNLLRLHTHLTTQT
ncbi:transposase [Dactylosporangium sp. NPDC050688]|uniref:transposase n=1 Tax=Dactylosporangium sp. NPDC050688 TaxID=3157217 RepID=UPI0033C668DE